MKWTSKQQYVKAEFNTMDELRERVRIAAFDMDDTLCVRPRGNSKDDEWKLVDESVIGKITELINSDYIIVVFSNQSSMKSKKFNINKWKKNTIDLFNKLTSMVEDDTPMYFAFYFSKTYDMYRKPNIGLWELFKDDLVRTYNLENLRISQNSFYCGDAGGRIKNSIFKKQNHSGSAKRGDFSDTDRKFALNIHLPYYTPEELFLGNEPMEYELSGFNAKEFIKSAESTEVEPYVFVPRKKELIIMVGTPGSGKSEFVRKYILPHNYVYINNDTCPSRDKCMAQAKAAMKKNKSVVIDNTNVDMESRRPYIDIALEYNYTKIRAIIMKTDPDLSTHLNIVRHIYSDGKISQINPIALRGIRKRYLKPEKYEHFDKIETVKFQLDPELLADKKFKKIFLKWTEKM